MFVPKDAIVEAAKLVDFASLEQIAKVLEGGKV